MDNNNISALETFVIIMLYKSTFTIPYHSGTTLGLMGEFESKKSLSITVICFLLF